MPKAPNALLNINMKITDITETPRADAIEWTASDAADEHDEVAYQLENAEQDGFPDWVVNRLKELVDFNSFKSDVANGKIVKLSRHDIEQAGNTGDSWADTVQWTSPEKEKRTPRLFKKNAKIKRPIYLKNNKNNELWLLAGHHRSTYASDVLKQPVEATVI